MPRILSLIPILVATGNVIDTTDTFFILILAATGIVIYVTNTLDIYSHSRINGYILSSLPTGKHYNWDGEQGRQKENKRELRNDMAGIARPILPYYMFYVSFLDKQTLKR